MNNSEPNMGISQIWPSALALTYFQDPYHPLFNVGFIAQNLFKKRSQKKCTWKALEYFLSLGYGDQLSESLKRNAASKVQ